MIPCEYAIFIDRSFIDAHWPVFEIISGTEIRYALQMCVLKGWLGAISRLVLLAAQHYFDDFEDHRVVLLVASIERRMYYAFFSCLLSQITVERMVATFFWSWYEKQGKSTILVLIGTGSIMSIFCISTAVVLTFHIESDAEIFSDVHWTLFSFFVISVGAGLLGYVLLLRYNVREVKKLQKKSGAFGTYSLARTYQLKENIAVMKMILKMAGPVFKFTTPAMMFYVLYILPPKLPEFEFIRMISVAMFDWSIAVLSLAVTLTFPVFDFRFRRVAKQLPIFRCLMTAKNLNSSKVFAATHLTNNFTQATDVYFGILEKDWNEPRTSACRLGTAKSKYVKA